MRIGTTTLESFRLFMEPDNDWMDEGELIATIKGETIATPAMLLGQAFGRCLEKGDKYLKDGAYHVPVKVPDGWKTYVFGQDVIQPAFDLFDRRGVFEARATRQYCGVKVVAKVDHILGTAISETKAKESTFDFDKYANGCQWRFLLDLFEGATSVTYHIFRLDEDEEGIRLRDIDTFRLYPYAELHRDCTELAARFVEYVRAKGLVEFLERKQIASENHVNELTA